VLLAAFGGIRGNLPALESVLGEVERAGILTVLNTGNSVLGYPWPNEVVDRLSASRVVSVQGIDDRQVVRALHSCAANPFASGIAWTRERLSAKSLEYLRALPKRAMLKAEGIPICLCHGMPSSQAEVLRADDKEARFRRVREETDARIVVVGGLQPFSREVDGVLFVCAGSAGFTESRRSESIYALINTEQEPWSVSFPCAAYDPAALGTRLKECGLTGPWAFETEL
jgi:predicted phosphodiesterase